MPKIIITDRIKSIELANPIFTDFIEGYVSYLEEVEKNPPKLEPLDLCFGNPHSILPGYVEALKKATNPTSNTHYEYQHPDIPGTESQRDFLARRNNADPTLPDGWVPGDAIFTTGSFAALYNTICTLVNPGDEVVFFAPFWFFYTPMVKNAGGKSVVLKPTPDFDIDVDAVARSINRHTKVIILNTPNNPTGKIYPAKTLKALARVLNQKSEEYGHRIFLLSDEPYRDLVFNKKEFVSPLLYYPHSLISYSWGKRQLNPGQRIGFLGVNPSMPEDDKKVVREAVKWSLISTGWQFPGVAPAKNIEEIDKLCLDIVELKRKRDLCVRSLREKGWNVICPQGTFYITFGMHGRLCDDMKVVENIRNSCNVLLLPLATCGLPGWIRVTITASYSVLEEMCRRMPDARSLINKL